MKTSRLFLALVCGSAAPVFAQVATTPPGVTEPVVLLRTEAELDQLLGPIALYPDAIIALILPASTVPADVVLAARQMRAMNNDRSQVELRAWDESVKSLTFYPDVLKWMDDNLEWTRQVGQAFLAQPADVMNAIQRLRARARAAGTLTDTPQQQILVTPDVIRIVPAQPDVIYVPQYEPSIVYVDRPIFYRLPPLSWGVGIPVGSWLAYDCDWVNRKIWVGDRHRHWQGQDWRRPVVSPDRPSANGTLVRAWRPSPSALDRGNFVGPRPAVPQSVVPPPANEIPRPGRPARDFSRGRMVVIPPNPTAAPVAPAPLPAAPPIERTRSLPNVISRSQLPVAPSLPATINPLPVARETRAFVGPPTPTSSLAVVPPLPAVAAPLPAVAPSFADPTPSAGTNNNPATSAPDRPASHNPRGGRRPLDN